MSDDYQRVEIITGTERRRRWSAEEKLRIVEEPQREGVTAATADRTRSMVLGASNFRMRGSRRRFSCRILW